MQLEQLTKRIHTFTDRQYTCLSRSLVPLLRQNGIFFLKPEELNEEQETFVEDYFRSVLFPVLTPLAVDRSRPFPLLLNKSLNLAVRLRQGEETAFAVVQVPSILPRLVELPSAAGRSFIMLENILIRHLSALFELHDIAALGGLPRHPQRRSGH